MAARKTSKRKYGKKAQSNVEEAMRARKKGTLRSGSGAKVKSKKQAIAIALSEARKSGGKVPRKSPSKRKATGGSSKRKATKRASTKRASTKRTSTKRTSSKRKASGGATKRKTSKRTSKS